MSLDEMLADTIMGTLYAQGFQTTWQGYKLHIDTADCGVPLSAILTSASIHDSQVAIPLAMMTAGRVTNLYDLMDSAYDAREIHQTSERLGHVPIIDVNPRRDKELKEELDREVRARRAAGHVDPGSVRFRIRSGVERTRPPQGRVRRAPCPRDTRRSPAISCGILALTVATFRRPIGRLRQTASTSGRPF